MTFSFPGQKRSCYSCLKVAHECSGNGIAKDCEAAGGQRKLLSLHMQEFWEKIKYTPDVLPSRIEEQVDNVEQQVGGIFTPQKIDGMKESEGRLCSAVSVKWFPKKTDHGDIMEFLHSHGLPSSHDSINIKENGQVIIENLDSKTSELLCTNLTGKKFKDKKNIYCQGIVLVTPDKPKETVKSAPVASSQSTPPISSSSGMNTLSANHSIGDPLANYEFANVKKSKFFANHNESESEADCSSDSRESEAEKWQLNFKKRKQQNGRAGTMIKKLDRKTTPKNKNK